MSKKIRVSEVILGKKSPRRKPTPRSIEKQVLLRSKGKCEGCHLDFHKTGITPHIHHKDGNPKNYKPSNLMVVCPNCHGKLQGKIKRKKTKSREPFPPLTNVILGTKK